AAVAQAREIEGLHQLRVGLRRLGVAFSAFGDEVRGPRQRELQERTKAFASAIAPARDLDVFAEELFPPPVAAVGDDAAFAILRERLDQARVEAWERTIARVASTEFAVLLDEIAGVTQSRRLGPDPADEGLRAMVKTAAPRRLEKFLAKARKRGRHLKSLEQRNCHHLRIALKKLRYACEFYAPLYKRKRVKKYLKSLKDLQDLLGAFNDAGQVRATLSLLTSAEAAPNPRADLFFAAGVIQGWHSARAQSLGKSALRHWDSFKRADPFWT
ncbi:MAG: CHAD domain-containing protein, partial [Alphaproteobacteria bacterium]|nr:CHAD domain-containing protein [Alphaproteobacteria bacterium]